MTAAGADDLGALADPLAQSLAGDPVHVTAAAEARVPDEAAAQLREKAQALPYPVHVVLVDDALNEESGSELVDLLADRVGEDGVYLVASPHGRVSSAVVEDGTEALDDAREAIASTQGSGSGYEGVRLVSTALDALAEDAGVAVADGEARDAGTSDRAEGMGEGTSSQGTTGQSTEPPGGPDFSADQLVLGVLLAGIVVAAAVFAVVGLVTRRRAARLALPPRVRMPADLLLDAAQMQRSRIRAALIEDTLGIAARLRALDSRGLPAEQVDEVRRGLDAYTFAGRLVDADDVTRADLAGALVLLMEAGGAVDRAESAAAGGPTGAAGGRRGASRTDAARLCTVDPTHGASSARARLPRGAGAGTTPPLPVCAPCQRDLTAGRTPAWLHDRGRPYVERDTVWSRTCFGAEDGDLVEMIRVELVGRAGGPGA
ncbi:hypothetical protein [Brevibacterium senegalense]|uniref:hypothetical protein n=1 Tax=Brevibacterium senegalense TaxID=1033736 RepID=UPI0002F4F5B4|nr:hypothetical protein [Brevibacterium senegalense]